MGQLQNRDSEDFKEVASTAAGMRFLSRLIDGTGVYKTTFNSDVQTMAFSEGQRSVGLSIVSEIAKIDMKEALLSAERYRANLYKEDMEAGKSGNESPVRQKGKRTP